MIRRVRDEERIELSVRAVRAHRHSARLLRPFVTSRRRTEAVDYVVAEVELESGVVGQGTAAETVAVTGESAETILQAVGGPITAALSGARGTVTELAALVGGSVSGATSARAAVDVALHDAWAKEAGAPLVELFGGEVGGSLANDMTVSLEEPEVMARRAKEAVEAGARILKIKLGQDTRADRERLDAVLAAVPEVRLRLDANQGWDVEQAVSVIRGFEKAGLPVDLVEQPVEAGDIAGLAQVRAAVSTPIMADEAVWSADDARRIIEAHAADQLNIKLAKTGGLREAFAIADVAAAAGIECMVGAMMEPRISITAAAHLAFAHPAITMIDLDSPAWFVSSLPPGGYRESDGRLTLTGGLGLGLDLLDPGDDPAT